jgi:hypothetical protein
MEVMAYCAGFRIDATAIRGEARVGISPMRDGRWQSLVREMLMMMDGLA